MVLDTSALLAILQNEAERASFITNIVEAPVCRISAASYVEAGIVMQSRYGRAGLHQLMLFLSRANVSIEPVDKEQAELALEAYHRYGKGRHKAALNYGDCFSYALASAKGEPLLYKGTDFSLTDL
jgi:ribonuclease VapC